MQIIGIFNILYRNLKQQQQTVWNTYSGMGTGTHSGMGTGHTHSGSMWSG